MSRPASRQTQQLLLAGQALLWLQLLLQGQLQPLLVLALPVLMGLQLRTLSQRLPRPWLLTLTVGLLLAWGISQTLGPSNGLLASVSNLLWLMLGLQQLEARHHGQQQRSVLLVLLSIGLAGLGSQGLAASLMQGAAALLALAGLHNLESGGQRLLGSLRRMALLMAIALPLLLTSFVLLPRLEPLWSLPTGNSGRSGLSERLAPGELAALVQDNALAARVSFAAAGPPPAEQRYWRVLVHQRFDGRSWSAADNWPRPPAPAPTAASPLGQRWIVEPTQLRQKPWDGRSLPLAGSKPPLQVTDLGTLESSAPPGDRQLYSLATTASSAPWQLLPPTAIDLQLPAATNPRLRALGRQWATQATGPEARIALAQQWFGQQGFAYSLEPGELGSRDPLDRFLFETRRGFCEHYAASFSALMRAAGVPARVVVGYQGGAWQQPAGDTGFLQLNNSDAHAWSEVWLPGRGWVGVDPTAWVVPERIRSSLADSLSPSDQQRLSKPAPGWLRAVATEWQGLDYRWQLWVMGFDRQRQVELLGQHRWQGLVALAAMALTLAGGLAVLWRPWQQTQDRARRCLNQTLKLLRRHGHPIQAGESLGGFCQRVGQADPSLAQELQLLAALYEQWRFGPPAPARSSRAALLNLQASTRRIKACLVRGRRHSA
jgi:transglutaminase-like putative cysteine protease